MIKVVGFKKLKNNTKKYEITFQKNGKKYIRKFGAAGMSDYTIHKDRERRERYISRHKKDLKTKDPMKPGYLSMFILWNKPSLSASLADYKRRLNVYNKTGKFPIGITGSKKLSFGGLFDGTSLSKLPDDILQLINQQKNAMVIQDTSKKYDPKMSLINELLRKGLKTATQNLARARSRSPPYEEYMEDIKNDSYKYVYRLWMNLDPVNDFTAKWLTRASKVLVKKDFDFEIRNFWWKVIQDQLSSMNEIEEGGNPVDTLNDVKFEYYRKCKLAIIVILNTVGYIDARGDLDGRLETPWTAYALTWWKERRTNDVGKSLFGDSPIPNNVVNKKLYASIKAKIKKSTIGRRWGAYDSGRLVREYKAKGGKYKGGKGKGGKGKGGKGNSNLGRWYKEKWVDACAWPRRKSCSNKSITYCRPSKKVDAKTPKLVQQFTRAQLKSRCAKKKKNPMTRVTNFGMPPSRKDNIPVSIKEQVWLRDCHRADPRIAQCKTCLAVVKYPQSLSRHFPPNELLPYNVSGTGEYGHIIAEAQGGRVTAENLFIQCKSCNTTLGANTAELRDYNDDQFMLETTNDDNMLVDSGIGDNLQCIATTGKNVQCKNKALGNRSLCGIHCKY